MPSKQAIMAAAVLSLALLVPSVGGASDDDATAVDLAAQVDLDAIRQGDTLVPRLELAAMPPAVAEAEAGEPRKRLFLKAMLPPTLKANAAILDARDLVRQASERKGAGLPLPEELSARLEELATRYGAGAEGTKEIGRDEIAALERRVDIVPASLVLAQAAIESGWGSSRFAREGNALFGQRVYRTDVPGFIPARFDSDPGFRVRAFDTPQDAIASFMHNLNTHDAYAPFREMRKAARADGRPLDGAALAAGLERYSERGMDYVDDVQRLIAANALDDFDTVALVPSEQRAEADSAGDH